MKTRIWGELAQVKFSHCYCVLLLAQQRRLLNVFTIVTLLFSGAGIMGYKIWEDLPILSCIIVSTIQLIRLLQPQIISSDKQIEKLDSIVNFYFDYYNELEQLWMDCYHSRCNTETLQERFYALKKPERDINKIINEVTKYWHPFLKKKATRETREYFSEIFKTDNYGES